MGRRVRRGLNAHRARRAVAALLVATLGAACVTNGASELPIGLPEPAEPGPERSEVVGDGPHRGGTLRVALPVDPVSLDPRFVVDDEGELLIDALFDPLVRVDDAGQVVPAAALRYEMEEDGRRFVFHLREATFHDGSPVTAGDFKRTFDHIADVTAQPPSFLAYLLADVVGIERSQRQGGGLAGVRAVDDRTLVIELQRPQPTFLLTLTDPSLVPLPPAAFEDPASYAGAPVGNGPFAMAGPREPGAFIRLLRVDGHPNEPWLDEVLFTIYDGQDGESRQWQDLLEGQLHLAHVAPERYEEAEERFGRSRDGYAGPGLLAGVRTPVYLYGMDTTQAPFDDPRLRQALSLAIDRQALVDTVTDGLRVPATSIIPPGIAGSQPGVCGYCRHDPARARELLAELVDDLLDPPEEPQEPDGADGPAEEGDVDSDEVAVPRPTAAELIGPLTLTYNRGSLHGAIAERMAADIADALELDVEFQGQDLGPFVQAVRRGDVPLFRQGWDVTEPNPAAYLFPLFHSSQVGMDNLTRFSDTEVDELLDRARASDDPAERRRLLREAERRILDQMPVLPVLWYRHSVVIGPQARDLSYSNLGRLSLSAVWLDPTTDGGTPGG